MTIDGAQVRAHAVARDAPRVGPCCSAAACSGALQIASFILKRPYSWPEGVVAPILRRISIMRSILPEGSAASFFLSWTVALLAVLACVACATLVGYMYHVRPARR